MTIENIIYALDQSTIVAITDRQGVITYVNQQLCQLSHYSQEELIGKTHRVLNSSIHSKSFFEEMWKTILDGDIWKGEVCNRAKDGTLYWVNTTIVPIYDQDHDISQFVAIRSDITKQKIAEEKLKISMENDFLETMQQLQNLIFKITKDEHNEYYFSLFEGKIASDYNLSTGSVKGKKVSELLSICEEIDIIHYLDQAFSNQTVFLELKTLDGHVYYCSLSPIEKEGEIVELVGSAVDITDRKEAEEQIHQLVFQDQLTNLPNRRSFTRDISNAMAHANQTPFYLMLIELDRFRSVNETLGRLAGDQVLKIVGKRLSHITKDDGTVYRLGDDAFAFLSVSPFIEEEIERKAEMLFHSIKAPFVIDHQEIFITSSIAVCKYPEDGKNESELLKHADMAIHMAKEEGGQTIKFYKPIFNHKFQERLKLEHQIRKAIENKQFQLYYQPQVDVSLNNVPSCEALIRWKQEDGSFIPPNKFIPLAEDTGLIVPLSDWVISEAVRQYREWQDMGLPNLRIGVNISANHFQRSDILDVIEKALHQYNMPGDKFDLEITESALMNDVQQAVKQLHEIKEMGIHISIDDFGTGYSSLSYLKNFPVDALKIDQAFVRDIEIDEKNIKIIRAIIGLANAMELDIIAEGIETKQHLNTLVNEGCNIMQGYHFYRPMPANEFVRLFK